MSNSKIESQEPEFYTVPALAKRWDTCYRSVHRRIQEGKLKAIYLAGLRVSKKEVQRVEEHGF